MKLLQARLKVDLDVFLTKRIDSAHASLPVFPCWFLCQLEDASGVRLQFSVLTASRALRGLTMNRCFGFVSELFDLECTFSESPDSCERPPFTFITFRLML